MIHLGVVSILPTLLAQLQHGMIKKAISLEKLKIDVWNPRDWAQPPACQVDDTPYGGGPGMVLRYEPLAKAIQFAKSQMPPNTKVIYLSPQGKTLQQHMLNQIATTQQSLLFIAGRYEGIDERVIDAFVDEEWSLGDFVLSGGELPAMVCIDAIARLIPDVLGDSQSSQEDSFMHGTLDHPHYTKPACIDGRAVPSVLLSGDHHAIAKWRQQQRMHHTWVKRPDLYSKQHFLKETHS